MREFDPNPTTFTVADPSFVDHLKSRGFVLHGAPGTSVGGVTVRGPVSQHPDGTFSMKCVYFDSEGETASGIHMHAERIVGYLTQAGADALREHHHRGCDSTLELHATPTA